MRVTVHIRVIWLLVVLAGCTAKYPQQTTPTPPAAPSAGPTSWTVGQDWWQGRCVDTLTFVNDSSNCDRCGNRCSYNESCTGGFRSSAPDYESCMARCVR